VDRVLHRPKGGRRSRRSPAATTDDSFGVHRKTKGAAPARPKSAADRKTNMKALEGAGYVHLYGLSSVLNALWDGRRDFTRPEDNIDLDSLTEEEYQHEMKQRDRKPEAQFSPWLFVQEKTTTGGGRAPAKTRTARKIETLAEERGIPTAHVDKGVLNTLSGNRPHQGYVLRCGKMEFNNLARLPLPKDDPEAPNLWLALDEVVDPQNLGALLRSVYFLGGEKVGILVCGKNSAPPSPVVSAASAGALELLNVYSTPNMPKTMANANLDGFRIVGCAASVAATGDDESSPAVYDLQDLPHDSRPTIILLGSEGHGLRPLVAKSCTEFVCIPGSPSGSIDEEEDGTVGVDSLNVSVTGGVLLWHFLRQLQGQQPVPTPTP